MTGSAGWSYYAATRYLLGVRPNFSELTVDPCIPSDWEGFRVTRRLIPELRNRRTADGRVVPHDLVMLEMDL